MTSTKKTGRCAVWSKAVRRAAGLGLCVLLMLLTACTKLPESVTVPQVSGTNYHNYITACTVDCLGGKLALYRYGLRSTLAVYNRSGLMASVKDVRPGFQLWDGRLYYIHSSETLKVMDLASGKTTDLAEHVDVFMVNDDGIYYLETYNPVEWTRGLYRIALSGGTPDLLRDNVSQFYLHGEKVYVVDDEDWLRVVEGPSQTRKVLELKPQAYPYIVMPQGDYIWMDEPGGVMERIHTQTGVTDQIIIPASGHYTDWMNFICDETQVVVSYQATTADGSVVKDVKDDANGVWTISAETLEKRKICSTYFESLFLQDDVLLGMKENELYQIDMESGDIRKLA